MSKSLAKKLLIIFLICSVVTGAWIFLPIEKLIVKLPYVNEFYSNTSLTINLRNGKAEVEIDGKSYGETNQVINGLSEGSYTVTLNHIANEDYFYEPQTFTIDMTKNTDSIIDIEIGPATTKAGYLLYYSPAFDIPENKGSLSVATTPKNASISFNNKFIQKSDMNVYTLDGSSYKLSVKKDGYEAVELPIVIRKGYNLNITVYLLPIPTQLGQEDLT